MGRFLKRMRMVIKARRKNRIQHQQCWCPCYCSSFPIKNVPRGNRPWMLLYILLPRSRREYHPSHLLSSYSDIQSLWLQKNEYYLHWYCYLILSLRMLSYLCDNPHVHILIAFSGKSRRKIASHQHYPPSPQRRKRALWERRQLWNLQKIYDGEK